MAGLAAKEGVSCVEGRKRRRRNHAHLDRYPSKSSPKASRRSCTPTGTRRHSSPCLPRLDPVCRPPLRFFPPTVLLIFHLILPALDACLPAHHLQPLPPLTSYLKLVQQPLREPRRPIRRELVRSGDAGPDPVCTEGRQGGAEEAGERVERGYGGEVKGGEMG